MGLIFSRHQPRFFLVEATCRDEVRLFLSVRYDLIYELTFQDVLYRLRNDSGPEERASAGTAFQ